MAQHRLFAATYDTMTRPMERAIMRERRARLLPGLTGHVLEVGAGTGANLPHYRDATQVTAAEPSEAMRQRLTTRMAGARVPVEIISDAAENLRLPDASVDAVVFTFVLCSVRDQDRALSEARRVLRPGGRLIVLEHVRGTGGRARWQDRLTPIWSVVNAGCHLNRDTAKAIDRAGFSLTESESSAPFPRWVPTQPLLEAIAILRD